ncbi:MAG: dTDP-4-dehydrorhamnose reductase [Betaproteobacteria bacterium]|nr:dTDP-4-dehydrorhamnose reductase [Betaproteobacteria bacterium]
MRVLLTGRNGQVGAELERSLGPLGEVIATDRAALDLADPESIRRAVREARPAVIVNAAAYTAVDRAESEPDAAMRINAAAPGVLAVEAKRLGALLVHYSTDYVFDGAKGAPYTEEDRAHPVNAYGKSKLEGEQAIVASGCHHLILRTSWVYSARGNNFLRTILRRAREQPELRVVNDQIGAPTSAAAIARATAAVLKHERRQGIFHMSAAGKTSWHGFAEAIVAHAGLVTRVVGIRSEDYPTVARRPRNSLLDNAKLNRVFGIALEDWRGPLGAVMAEVR